MKFKPIGPDYIVLATFILMVATHSITHFLVAQHMPVEKTREEVKKILDFVEGNPIAGWVLQFKKIGFLYSYFIVPSVFFGMYYWFRKKYINNPDLIWMGTLTLLMAFLLNFLNDFTYLLAFFI